jgi:hypothetical protein
MSKIINLSTHSTICIQVNILEETISYFDKNVTTTSTLTDTLVFGDELGQVHLLSPSGSSVIFQVSTTESGSVVVRDLSG